MYQQCDHCLLWFRRPKILRWQNIWWFCTGCWGMCTGTRIPR